MKKVLTKILFIAVLGIFIVAPAQAQSGKEAKAKEKEIKKLSKLACECSDKISTSISKDEIVDEINDCIFSAIVTHVVDESFKGIKDVQKELKKGKIKITENDTTVVVDKQQRNAIYANASYREIQDYMMTNCDRVLALMKSEDMASDKSYSQNAEALKYYKEGEDYEGKGKYDKAIAAYKKALAIDPEFAFAWDNLGLCYRKNENFDEAIECYKKSLEVDPYGLMPLQNMAVAYEYKKDYISAAATYQSMIDKYPDNPEGFFGAGRAYYFAGNLEKGVDNMFKAYKLYVELKSPYVSDAEKNLGAFWNDLKQKDKESIFTDAAKTNGVALE